MKGVVFVEFMAFVEDVYGQDMVDAVIDDAGLPHDGAYTSVGTYPFTEMQALTVALAARSREGVERLLTAFGTRLCGRFAARYPHFFLSQPCLFDFIESVDRTIHVEVHKLYPDAELPRFATRGRTVDSLGVDYVTCRPLEALAEGMMLGAAAHFGQAVSVDRARTGNGPGGATRFTIRLGT